MATISFNLPLLSISAYYILCLYPHAHASMLAVKGNLKNHDNRNPHSSQNLENLKRRLTNKEFAAYERAERCHKNHPENMPLLIAAIFAGLLAEQRVGEGEIGLIGFAVGFLVFRMLYTISYIYTETVRWSYVRSTLYAISTLWAFYMIGKASFILGK